MGQRIERARKRAVLSKSELAEAAGIARSTLWGIEQGTREPEPKTIRKIAAALGVDPRELVADEDEGV